MSVAAWNRFLQEQDNWPAASQVNDSASYARSAQCAGRQDL